MKKREKRDKSKEKSINEEEKSFNKSKSQLPPKFTIKHKPKERS